MVTNQKEPLPLFGLGERHASLPHWAQREISELRADACDSEMAACLNADIRRTARRVLGGNCTYSDDDLSLLAHLAVKAIDAGLHVEVTDRRTLANIDRAAEIRAQERAAVAAEAAAELSEGI